MKFDETVEALKTTYSRQIFQSYGYDNTRRKYTALESGEHNHGDRTPSMGLHSDGNAFYLKDFAGTQKKYSSIDTIMLQEGLSFADAVKRGADMCGIRIDSDRQQAQEELSKVMRYVIAGLYRKAERESFSVREILSTHHYHYKDVDGKKLFDKFRIDYLDGDGRKRKHFIMGVDNNGFLRKFKEKEYQDLIAMYGDYRRFGPGEKIYICEGEECVKISQNNGLKNIVTIGSSGAFEQKGKMFAQFFQSTDVIILQDNDVSGEKLTKDIIFALQEVANSIKVIVPDRSKEKADIADFFQNGGTVEQLEEMERKTEPVQKASGQGRPNLNIGQDAEIDYTPFHFYNNKGEAIGINHNAIAEDIKAKHSLFVSGFFYEGDRGHFKPDATGAKIKGYIKRRILPYMRKSQVINQIYNLLHDDFSIERDFKDTNLYPARWVPFNDCLLDPLTWEEMAYEDKYFCTNRLPHNWRDCKNATEGEETEKFLHFAIPDEQDREMALGFDGLSCNRDTSFQKALLEVGQGGSGKSIKIRLLQAMLGAENYSNIGLFDLGKRFMPGLLLGKLANICSDLPLVALKDEASEALKLIVGEDVIFHESKGQNGFFFTPFCKMTFSTNLLPQVLDERNNAVFRRLLILRMDNTPEHPDVNLFSRLNKELPYYIKLCMDALHRIYERGQIFESENSKSEIDQMRRDSDTTEDFLDVCCVKESGARIDRGELFTKYERHCESEGRQSLSKNAFNKAIRAKGYKQVKSCGYWFFEGISLKKSSLNLPTENRETSLNGVEVDADGFMRVDEEALKDLPFT